MTTLEDLFTLASKDELLEAELAIATAVDLPATQWQSGGVARTILEIVAQILADQDVVRAEMVKSGFLDLAAHTDGTLNPWLTALAKSTFGVDRILATFATGKERLTNSTASPIVVTADTLHFAKNDGSASYKNTSGGTIPATGTLDVDIACDQAGSIGSAAAGEITTLVTTIAGVTVSNPAPLIGADAESDPLLVIRCRAKLGSLSPNGPAKAYEFAVLSALLPDGSPAGLTRVQVKATNATGSVTVWIADPDGTTSGAQLTAATASVDQIAVPLTVTATVLAAVQHTFKFSLTVYSRAPLPTAAEVLSAMTDYFGRVPIGGVDIGGGGMLFLDGVSGSIHDAFLQVQLVQFSTMVDNGSPVIPPADATIAQGEVPILTSITSDITVIEVS